MRRSHIFNRKYQLIFLVLVFLWGDWLSYKLYSKATWPDLGSGSVRILLIADPQLIGYQNEHWMIGWLARWDSDRYLTRGYNLAKTHSAPNAEIFLGDLFDEGVEGDEYEFRWTLDRFRSIFPEETSRLYISGDNDIGGEISPAEILPYRKDRFAQSFPNNLPDWPDFRVDEVNLFEWPAQIKPIYRGRENSSLTILLSHQPISPGAYLKTKKVHETLPDLVLSAHDHSAYYHSNSRTADSVQTTLLDTKTDQITGSIGKELPIIELQSPTCSYRMGTTTVGYGVLLLNKVSPNEYSFAFTILWLPSRFPQLILYLLCIFLDPMSCATNLLLASGCPLCYVVLVLTFDYNGKDRNAASSVRKRLLAAILTSAISVTLTNRQLNGDWEAMGFRSSGILPAALLPSVAVLILYAGQLLLLFFDGQLKHYLSMQAWKNCFTDICWVRDILVAPITEEIVYRACSVSLVATCFSKWQTVFLTPMLFGLSHLHHILNDIKTGFSPQQAVLRRGFQFAYTYVFGAYSSHLLLSTRSIVAPIVTHCICNALGLPLFGEIENFPCKWQRRALWTTFVAGIVGFVYFVGPLTDSKLYL